MPIKPDARILALILALLPPLALASCGKTEPPRATPPAETAPRRVSVAQAQVRPMERVLQVTGTLGARDEALIAAQVAGQIEKSYVDVGDRVRTGQRIALIDTASYQVLVRQTTAALARANARAASNKRNLERVQQLHKEQIIPAIELDQAESEEAQARADVQVAQAAAAIARLNLDRSQVKAPFDGTIAERIAAPGGYVAVGAPIARLVQVEPLRLRMQVSERDSSSVRPGQLVRVTVEGDPVTYPGKLARISPAIRESDRTLQVEADVPNTGGLRAGLFARAQIVITDQEQGVTVPSRALVTFAGLDKVVVIKDGKAAEKAVTTGRRGEGWIEIVSGVKAGDTVALEPSGLRTGQAVRVSSPAAAAEPNPAGARL